jgi:hypothetical protein
VQANQVLTSRIVAVHANSRQTYGYLLGLTHEIG